MRRQDEVISDVGLGCWRGRTGGGLMIGRRWKRTMKRKERGEGVGGVKV